MKNVVIVGTGGHARVVADIVLSAGDHLEGFLTSDRDKETFLGRPVLGDSGDYKKYADCCFVIAIGSAEARERISNEMQDVKWYTAIHPSAVISSLETEIGEGSVVMANAVINPCARVGKHCIINTNAVVEHEDGIGDYAHVSVGAKLAGAVNIGRRSWIGVGAAVSNGISICDDCMIGAGAVVIRNIEQPGTYVGVPAKRIK